jgi:hypothetical protein
VIRENKFGKSMRCQARLSTLREVVILGNLAL